MGRRRHGQDGVELSAETLAAELEAARAAADVRRQDELLRERAEAAHGRRRADLATEMRLAELDRAEREAAAQAAARLGRMYRQAREAGERTRIASVLARSGEARALRLEKLRAVNLKVLLPVLLGFAAWSTTGVQDGAARLMRVNAGDPMWWVLWLLEPVLIGAVVWVIVARARLAACGGRMDAGAEWIAGGCLFTSVVLNLISAFPDPGDPGGWPVVGSMIAHAIGPVGAAATAHLIGLVDKSIADADPWTEVKVDPKTRAETRQPVPLLSEMNLRPPRIQDVLGVLGDTPENGSGTVLENGSETGPENARPVPATVWPVPVGERRTLPIVARPGTAGERVQEHPENGRTFRADQGEERDSGTPAENAPRRAPRRSPERSRARSGQRPDKGVPVPPSARKSAVKTAPSDEDLAVRLAALVAEGALPADPSQRAVKSALGIGIDRTRRVLDLYHRGTGRNGGAAAEAVPAPTPQEHQDVDAEDLEGGAGRERAERAA